MMCFGKQPDKTCLNRLSELEKNVVIFEKNIIYRFKINSGISAIFKSSSAAALKLDKSFVRSCRKELTLSQTTIFRLFQTEMVCNFADNNFKFDRNGGQFSKRVENTGGKREIARYEQFLFFPQCFQKTFTADT